ncbi:MAG: hypothetical protein ACM3WV_07400 [Bacillota bacterium]
MLKTKNRLLSVLFILIFASSFSYAIVPYDSYNYDEPPYPTILPIPSAPGYIPVDEIVAKDMGFDKMTGPGDLFLAPDGSFYVVDTGNNRIVHLDGNLKMKRIVDKFMNDGVEDRFNAPLDVFVTEEGVMYVADTENRRVVILNKNGELLRLFGKPNSSLVQKDYKPQKIAVDKSGKIYIVENGETDGLLQVDQDGRFLGYFGANRAQITLLDRIWRLILTKEMKKHLIRVVSAEIANIAIDNSGFIYTTTCNVYDYHIKRLNRNGVDIMKHEGLAGTLYGDFVRDVKPPMFSDVFVDADGNFMALNQWRGRIFVYNSLGDLLFIFGGAGSGDQKGMFKVPVALVQKGDYVYVLDQGKESITIFKITDFGKAVMKANNLYINGKYKISAEPWREVLKRDANYDLAYAGIGKAYFKVERYEDALKNFRQGYYRSGYSRAFLEYRSELLERSFDKIMTVIIIGIIGFIALRKLKKKPGTTAGVQGEY